MVLFTAALTQGPYIHDYQTRGRYNYRTRPHRTVVYEHLLPQPGVHLFYRLPQFFKDATTLKASKTRLKGFIDAQAFYSGDDFFAFDWETVSLANTP